MEQKPIPTTDEEWKGVLTPEQFHVLRQKGTERAFTGEYWNNHDAGEYTCAGCGEVLFNSDAKFESGCGWPSFYESLDKSKVLEHADVSFGMRRVEVVCSKCDGHLGHVFPDGDTWGVPGGQRYCINSASLKFQAKRD